MTLPAFIAAERESIHQLQHEAHVRGDYMTFARLEGRLEQLLALEAWVVAEQIAEVPS